MPKIFADRPWKEQGTKDKTRTQRSIQNIWPPAVRSKRCVAPRLCENYCALTFATQPWDEQGPEEHGWDSKVPNKRRERNYRTKLPPPAWWVSSATRTDNQVPFAMKVLHITASFGSCVVLRSRRSPSRKL